MDRFRNVTNMLGGYADQPLTRRTLLKRSAALGVAATAVPTLLAACGGDEEDDGDDEEPAADDGDEEEDTDDEEPADDEEEEETEEPSGDDGEEEEDGDEEPAEASGGTLNIALIGEPVHLDLHKTTTSIVAFVTYHIWEPLFTYDEEFQIAMDLAESYEATDDALEHTITLRQGVMFHNGEEMTSEDVIASIERWASSSNIGDSMLSATETLEAVDDYTIQMTMSEPYGIVNVNMSRQNQGCVIHPASVMEEIGDDTLQDNFVGTGPFQFEERAADRFIRVSRFEDYVARDEEPSGYAGRKEALVDEIEFIPVPDESARISGLQAGDYHFLEDVSPDQLVTLQEAEGVTAEALAPQSWNVFVPNWEREWTGNVTFRQAIQATLDHEPIALSAWGEGFFELQPGLMHAETAWHSTVGEDLYNRADPETGQELLEESGYDGTTLILMTTQEYAYMFNGASIVQQQLEDVGISVELDVVDWATLGDRREDPDEYDIFTTGMTFRVDPTMHAWISSCEWPGWWCTDEKEDYMQQHVETADFDERYAAFEEIQRLFYEDAALFKIADGSEPVAYQGIEGFVPITQLRPFFWNVSLTDA